MKQFWLLSIAIATIFSSCKGQTGSESNNVVDSLNTPNTNIQVNKVYDDDGNLIRYDSTYTYYYSNIGDDSVLNDSIFNEFRKQFNIEYPFSNRDFFDEFFFQDTLLKYDFFRNDFFTERFRRNMEMMDKLFWEMDSLKNDFYMQQVPKKKKNTKTI